MTDEQKSLSGRLKVLQRWAPGSADVDQLREQLTRSRVAEDLADWARCAADVLPPLCQVEVAAVARIAATIDARLSAS